MYQFFGKPMLVGLSVAAAALLGLSAAMADQYPARVITVTVPFPAGGSTDLMARATAREFSDFFGKNVVVTNVAGGAGTVGTAAIARARPDGYAIGIVPAAPLVNQPHMRETPYNLDSFEYVCQLFHSPQALAVKPDSPFATLEDLVEFAKANPGKLSYGSPGPGSLPHLDMERFLEMAGIEIKHVPFAGDGPGLTALLGGHVDLYMAIVNAAADKGVKAIAVFDDKRNRAFADVPTAAEQGYDMIAAWWGGVVAPKGVPEQVTARLNDACRTAAEADRFREALEKLGTSVQYRGPADFRKLVDEVSSTNGRLVRKLLDPQKPAKP